MITFDQLRQIMPRGVTLDRFVEPLNESMQRFEIDRAPWRQAAYIAQVAHESGQFVYMEELASGAAYDLRSDLGNTEAEAIAVARQNNTTPGRFYKGHGPIQITGYFNHKQCGEYLGIDLVHEPRLLCEPRWGCLGAGWFWHVKRLNVLADAGDFLTITKRINGGTTHLAERVAYWQAAKAVLL